MSWAKSILLTLCVLFLCAGGISCGSGSGGTGSEGFLNDLWKFDGTTWTWVSGASTVNQIGVYGTKGVTASTNMPGAREPGSSWTDSKGNFWLFGGGGYASTASGHQLNDLWKFDGTNWTWVSGANVGNQYGVYGAKGVADGTNMPGAREASISWIDGEDNLWLFGGWGFASTGAVGRLNDLWKFDGTNWTWVSGASTTDQIGVYGTKGIAASTNIPGARQVSISWTDKSDNLWLFSGDGYDSVGGQETVTLNDLWKFDGTNWTWISGASTGPQMGVYGTKGVAAGTNIPGTRDRSTSFTNSSGNLWLFGGRGHDSGVGDFGDLNDLWKFDGTNWTWVSGASASMQSGVYGTKGAAASANMPGAREGSISWTDSQGNLWLFGGSVYNSAGNSTELNDLWKFDGANWTWVSGASTVNQLGVYGTKGVSAGVNIPGARGGSISWRDSEGNLWIFGGKGFAGTGS